MPRPKLFFRWLHGLWFCAGAVASAMLASSTGGHPPGAVFLPFAILFWVIGHALIGISNQLIRRGHRARESAPDEHSAWPRLLALITAGCAIAFGYGLFALIAYRTMAQRLPNHFDIYLLLWLTPAICCVGIMLRQTWSRYLTATALLAAGSYIVYVMGISALKGRTQSAITWIIAIALVALCLSLAHYVARAPQVNRFFARGS